MKCCWVFCVLVILVNSEFNCVMMFLVFLGICFRIGLRFVLLCFWMVFLSLFKGFRLMFMLKNMSVVIELSSKRIMVIV